MIDFETLDKKKTYIGLEYGTSFIANQIRKFSKCYAPNSKEIPTHVFVLRYRYGSWWVYESHAKGYTDLGVPKGVRRYKVDIWQQVEKGAQKNFKAYEQNVNRKKLEEYIGLPYGIGDIKILLHASIHKNNGEQKDGKGFICSEYVAHCYSKICKYYKLPEYCITPAHFQNYFEVKGIKEVGAE